MQRSKKLLVCSCLVATLTVLGTEFAGVQAFSPAGAPTEAPAEFTTPSFNGAHSISSGIVEPPGDTFARDQQVYR
jgi:hypothetical protein